MTEIAASLSASETARVEEIHRLARGKDAAVPQLVDRLRDRSWAVRRAIISALAELGDVALPALVARLRAPRDSETELAALVDSLSQTQAAPEQVERTLSVLASDPDAAIVCDVAQILGRRRARSSIPLLSSLTHHSDDNVAVAAIEALGRIGNDAGVDAIIRLASGENFFRTFPAIDALGRSNDPRAVGVLTGLLEQPGYAAEAARALGRTADLRAVAPLARRLAGTPVVAVRVAALALDELNTRRAQRIGNDREVALIVRREVPRAASAHLIRAVHDADPGERLAITRALGWVGGDDAIEFLLRQLDGEQPLVEAAIASLRDLSTEVATQVEDALRGGDSARRAALLPLLDGATVDVTPYLSDADPNVRAAACAALARSGRTSAVPYLFARLTDADRRVAHVALGAVQSLGSAETERLTLEATRSPDAALRRAAFRLVGYFGYGAALEPTIACLTDADAQVRDAAMSALAFIDDPRAIDALVAACASPSQALRTAAVRALGQTRLRDDVRAALRSALSDAEAWVRYYAVQSLGKLRDDGPIDPLVAMLEDPAGQVRVAAIETLARVREGAASEALARALHASDPDVQRAALVGLGQSGRPEAIPQLLAAIGSSEATTRLVALSSLAAFEGDEVARALRDACTDADESVRGAALELLGARIGAGATRALAELLAEDALRARVTTLLGTDVVGRVEGLVVALAYADEELAPALTLSLARLRTQPARNALVHVLMTSEPVASRCAAAKALALLGIASTREAIAIASKQDPDVRVRRLCIGLLES